MKKQTVAVIISVYKDLEALKLIIDSLQAQSQVPDEIIVAEDAQHLFIKEYIQTLSYNNIFHVSHKDKGWRKEKILNDAIKIAKSDYLIFIDGDCVPYVNFVQAQLELSEKNTALCGRRSEPGPLFSQKLRSAELSVLEYEKKYLSNYSALKKDGTRHIDEGMVFSPHSIIFRLIHKFGRKNSHIVGCNWSCYKEDIMKINGFDEDFMLPTTGEDTDIERRMRHFGIKMKSCRNAAGMVHLYHISIFNKEISSQTEALMQTKKDIFVCYNGIKKFNEHGEEI